MDGLYIHIPFCKSKCKYCDFASFSGKENLINEYINKLCLEMKEYQGHSFDTVYIGGGTPTVLDNASFEKLFDSIYKNFNIDKHSEITVEANPKTIDLQKAKVLNSLGVNRISIGAQSMVDDELKVLGRIHTSDDTKNTVALVRDAGIDNISLDLMYALFNQTMDSLCCSIDQITDLAPNHISCYGLKIEEGTPFYTMLQKGEVCETDEDLTADMYDVIRTKLKNAGYEHYEISNFSKPGKASRHNTKYWKCVDYVGIGLGAASCFKGERYTNSNVFDEYFNGFKKQERYTLTNSEKMSEFIILGLRLIKEGVSKADFKNTFGVDIYDVFGDTINKHINTNLIKDTGKNLVLTEKSYYISNYVMSDFVNNL